MAVQDYKINYKSDFVLNINGDAGWAIPFCIKFWTGMPSQAYFVGFDGVKYINCRVGDTPTQLLVMFDDHHLPIGKLMMQIAYHTTIEEFPGSVFDEVTNARDVIVTIDGTDYQVMLDFTGEDAPELEFDLPAYANEAERIQNELQRQQNEAARIAAELQREQATAAAVEGAENVNAQLNGNTLTVTNRQGVSTSVNTKGEQGAQGPVGPEGSQGEQGPKGEKGDTGATGPQGVQGPAGPQGQTGVSITDFVKTGETETDTLYDIEFSDDTTKPVAIPKGEKGDQGEQGPEGPQGPMGDVAVITPEQQAAFTMYSETGQNTNGPMTQKAVTDALGNIAASRNIGLLNVYFDGIGTTYATSDKFYGVAGHILKFTLVEQNVPYDSITSAQSRFMIYSHDANDVETTLYRVNGTNLPDKEIVVCVPNDSVCLYIGGRCSRGYRYECEVVDISYDYKDTSIAINDLYYHLAGKPEYKYRINLLLPYQNNAVVKIRPKISTPTYQYEIDGVVINNDKTTTSTILIGYSNTQIDYLFKGGYSYIIVFFKKGNNLEVDKSELLSEYDINVEYPETIEELKIADGDKKWDLIGLSKISNAKAKTDFIVLPNLPMRVKMDIPIWMKVSFTTGNRTNRVYLGTYYSGDIVDFSQGSAGVFVGFQRLDDRGFDADFYTRHSKFLGMSLTQIGSNDGNIFERNFDNEKNLGGIMATGLQELQKFPTIVHVSDAHGDSFRLNAAHDYADYILADLVINTGDNPFFEMKDGVNFVKDIVFSHKTDFANCIGNHDQYTSTLADVFSKNISPFATEYGYHKSTSSDVTDKCYYYKDLSAQKIRIIVLDVYDGLVYQAYKARISQEQINWFVSTLSATPQDYGVIVVSHQAPHTINAISGKENFNDVTMEPQINALDSDYMRNGKITGNPLGKIIDAFIVKGSVSGSYTQKKATSSTNETISYSADFSNVASGVEFIAYINGHTHRDFIGYVADCENNQLNCNVCSTSPLSQTTGYGDKSDIYRDANGVAQDAFNVYTIDRYNHRLGVCRIGSNLSLNLIDRKVMWFDYV